MSKFYIILAIVLLALAGGLLLLPDSRWSSELEPEMLFKEINDPARYVTVDYVAERLINEDPSLLLVDVRSRDEYDAFALPGAMNIPLAEIDGDAWHDYLAQDQMDVVFYSNGDLFSDEAWIIATRMGFRNMYVMSGGLNAWFSCIMQPEPPPETASTKEFDQYAFRMAAASYFSGGSQAVETESSQAEPVRLIKRNKKSTTEGGC